MVFSKHNNQLEIDILNKHLDFKLVLFHLLKPSGIELEVFQLRTFSPSNIVRRSSPLLTSMSIQLYVVMSYLDDVDWLIAMIRLELDLGGLGR